MKNKKIVVTAILIIVIINIFSIFNPILLLMNMFQEKNS